MLCTAIQMDCKHEDICPFFQSLEEEKVSQIDQENFKKNKSKAFGNENMEYYELQIDIGAAKKGTIFYYDENDDIRGSITSGCLKPAWTEDGDCQCKPMLCADTIIFHSDFKKDETIFKRIWKGN